MSSAVDNVTESMAAASINEPTNGTAQNDAAIVSADEGRRLYIGNLAYATTEGELKEFFSGYSMYVSLHAISAFCSTVICVFQMRWSKTSNLDFF